MTEYLNTSIPQNYFTGKKELSLDMSMQEAEVMYGAADGVKAMAESGELNALHDRVASLSVASETQYNEIRGKFESIIRAVQAKEDEIYEDVMSDYPELFLRRHEVKDDSILSVFTNSSFFSTDNLRAIDKLKKT